VKYRIVIFSLSEKYQIDIFHLATQELLFQKYVYTH